MNLEPDGRSESERIVDDYYESHYVRVHGAGALGGAASVMHKALERGRATADFPTTLELGAGSFEHYGFVEHSRRRYIASDIRPPEGSATFKSIQEGSGPEDLEFMEVDALDIPLEDRSVDRVVASCLMIHLTDPMLAMREWQRVCRPDGVIDFLVPCDPGITSRVFRRVISQRTAESQGVPPDEYRLVNAIEHINPFGRVLTLARSAIDPHRRLRVHYFPFALVPSWNINAFAIFSVEPQ